VNRPASEEARWRAVAEDYAPLGGLAYMDTACMGVAGRRAIAAIIEHLAALHAPQRRSTTDRSVDLLAQFQRARRAAAKLIGAEENAVALMPSTEAGLAAVATSLRLPPGSNVVASTLEFAGTLMPWRSLAQDGVELVAVPHRDGRIEIEDLEAALNSRTKAIVISSVQEVNGFRVDLRQLASLGHARGIHVIVDAIQHAGPLELSVKDIPVDALAVGGHKWLCAPFGMGFLYVAPELSELLEPRMPSVMAALPPAGGWTRYLENPARHPLDNLDFPADTRKLELGALGTSLAAAGLAGAIETLLEIGGREIADRSAQLANAVREGLADAGAEIVTPVTASPSSIVTFRSASELDAERALVRELEAEGVLVSLRFTSGVGGIRVAPYFYNGERDVELLASLVARALRRNSQRRGRDAR
jgi:selenocysteine lyase/cysteine desulfurase